MPTNVRDPRSIITPDAFELSPALLGLPLARPSRRLAAILIDLLIIAILTALLSGAQLLLWGTVALILLYTSLRRTEKHTMGPHATMLLRASLGCLGAGILSTVLIVAAVFWWQEREADGEEGVGETLTASEVPGVVAEMIGSGGTVAPVSAAWSE